MLKESLNENWKQGKRIFFLLSTEFFYKYVETCKSKKKRKIKLYM
jgi:hypothetical protein